MNETTLAAARAIYWQDNHFGEDGGDRIHDLHHVLTGYATTWTGEAEIAAWALASGCVRWPAATVLDLGALRVSLLIAPLQVARIAARNDAAGCTSMDRSVAPGTGAPVNGAAVHQNHSSRASCAVSRDRDDARFLSCHQ